PSRDELLPVDVRLERAALQFVANEVRERWPSPWSSARRLQTRRFGTPHVELEVERPALPVANHAVVELTRDVTREIANQETNDLVVDSAHAALDGLADALVQLGRRKPARRDGRKVDQRSRRGQRMK